MTELADLIQQGFMLTVFALVPVVGAAVAAALVAGWLGARIGLSDPVATGVLRGVAVLWALGFVADTWADDARSLTTEAWSQLGPVGRAYAGNDPATELP